MSAQTHQNMFLMPTVATTACPPPRAPAGPRPLSAHPQLCREQVLIGRKGPEGQQCPCRTWTGSERSAG